MDQAQSSAIETERGGGVFTYQAQTPDEVPMSGVIEAGDAAEASRRLEGLGLRVLEVKPADGTARKGKAVSGEDFLAFNRQLAQLTQAGLPLEQGLRLIARDMRSGRLSRTVEAVAADLEKGMSLGEAFERHAGQFPPLYGRLVQAGIKANNLPGMLLNLGRHLEMVQRLRGMMWRACAYPLMVVAGLVGVVLFLGAYVLPQFAVMFADMKIELPLVTGVLLGGLRWIVWGGVAVIALVVLVVVGWALLRRTVAGIAIRDAVGLRLPLVGGVLRWNLVARWCDALRIAVEAGMDLPSGVALAGEAVGSRALARDGERVREMVERGEAMAAAMRVRMRVMPPSVPAAMALASERYDLAGTLGNLSEMYQRQAELRMGTIPTVLAPLLLLGAAGMIGVVVTAIVAPLATLMKTLTRF